MGKGIFPAMSVSDIVSSLGAWGVPIVPEQLHRPTADFVEGVYGACLYQVTNINHDALREPVQRILNQAQMVDKVLHEHRRAFRPDASKGPARDITHKPHLAVPSVRESGTLLPRSHILDFRTRLATAAKVEDFCAKDIQSPERERTMFLLSAFINFIKFTEQFCEPFVKKLRERSDEIIAERDRASRRLAVITQEIDLMK
jgi:kinetochore protein Nuf2